MTRGAGCAIATKLQNRLRDSADASVKALDRTAPSPLARSRPCESDPAAQYQIECDRQNFYGGVVFDVVTRLGEAFNNAFDNDVPAAFADRLNTMRQHGRHCIDAFETLVARPMADGGATQDDLSVARQHVAIAKQHAIQCLQGVFDLVNAYREESGQAHVGRATARGSADKLDLDTLNRDLPIVQSDEFVAWLKKPHHPQVQPLATPVLYPRRTKTQPAATSFCAPWNGRERSCSNGAPKQVTGQSIRLRQRCRYKKKIRFFIMSSSRKFSRWPAT